MGDAVEHHAGQYARQAEAVVAVQVRQADAGDAGRADSRVGHLPLGALARIEEQPLAVPPEEVTVVVAGPGGNLGGGAEDHEFTHGVESASLWLAKYHSERVVRVKP